MSQATPASVAPPSNPHVVSNLSAVGATFDASLGKPQDEQQKSMAIKDKRKFIKVNADLLTKPEGLVALAESAGKVPLVANQPGSEEVNLNKIMEAFDEWAQAICPTQDPEDFFGKVEKLGRSVAIQKQIANLHNLVPNKRAKYDDSGLGDEIVFN